MDDNKNSDINSEEHTLFIKHIPEEKKLVDKKKQTYKVTPKHKIYTVYIEKFKELKRGLHAVLNELRSASKHDKLEFRINSGGGYTHEGKQFYNLIQDKFYNRTTAYLDNYGYSMGALVFCMAKKRVIYPYSDLMFHNYGSSITGKGGEIVSRVEHRDKILLSFFRKIIVKNGFLSVDEFQSMIIGKDYWMDAKEMCERKIATHVIYKGKEIKANEYLKKLNSLDECEKDGKNAKDGKSAKQVKKVTKGKR